MPDLPPMTPPVKRSVTIGGHRTSVSLEDAFWRELRGIARERGETAAGLIAMIDGKRPPEVGLATALRLYVLAKIGRHQG
ncbi:MAG: ribbon-helix-helix domain-containing protein [Paracoccus sp. (in: a-proteobacteria)]|uniref:ribbon-helix-helix domain-containing protein n=1 Tax=Paracoccus sp. TaxID=267 RepID=UPI0039E6B290